MAALVGIAAYLRAVLAPHVTLKLVDRGGFWPSHDVQSDGLVRVATKTTDFEIEESGVEGVAQRRRRLGRAAIAEHTPIPDFACKFFGFLAGSGRAFSRSPDRTAVNCLA